jgi:hypothetical protein
MMHAAGCVIAWGECQVRLEQFIRVAVVGQVEVA